MWSREKEYSLVALLEHPILALAMANAGMDRRSIELLLEAASAERQQNPERYEEPINA